MDGQYNESSGKTSRAVTLPGVAACTDSEFGQPFIYQIFIEFSQRVGPALPLSNVPSLTGGKD